jgi:alpha-galactosidase
VRAGDAGYRFAADRDGRLRQIGFRPGSIERGRFPVAVFPLAYPTWGDDPSCSPALRVTNHDGVTTTRLVVDAHERTLLGTGEEIRIRLVDRDEPLSVVLGFRTWDSEQVLEQWVEISHEQPGPVVLHEAAAAAPAVSVGDAWLTHYGGGWAGEWTVHEELLTPGTKLLESRGAVRPHLQLNPFFLLSPSGRSTEHERNVLAGSLAWGGAVRLAFERGHRRRDHVRIWCGHSPLGAEYVLDPGDVFVSPRMVWAWSTSGRAPLTHRLHAFVRDNVVRDGALLRATVFNNWEATFFDYDEPKLLSMIDGARDLGAELFLLDDGWFGVEQPRDDDRTGLGDWVPNPRKLPNGIQGLAEAATKKGLRFGLWAEPEMVNPASQLYRTVPEWVVSQPTRRRYEERHQLVLDLCRTDVREFVTATLDHLLDENPGISYLKWDANRDITEPGSAALDADRQTNLWVDTIWARWEVMAQLADRHPETEVMLCASGGGRVDLGTLRHCHEVWLSDNTDAVTRVRMQWAASHFLPPQVIGAHVTRWGGQDLAFACAVAMSARFGFDLDPDTLTSQEQVVCRRATEVYHGIRDLVQHGELYRLVSPDEGGRAALANVAADRARAVVFAYQLADDGGGGRCPLDGLDPDLMYEVRSVDLTGELRPPERRSGADLLASGLDWPLRHAATAAIWELAAVDLSAQAI